MWKSALRLLNLAQLPSGCVQENPREILCSYKTPNLPAGAKRNDEQDHQDSSKQEDLKFFHRLLSAGRGTTTEPYTAFSPRISVTWAGVSLSSSSVSFSRFDPK